MSESRLDAAVRALRSSTDGRSDQADQTERAIVERLSRTRSRGSPRFSGLRLGLAFALLSSSVWALKGETGSRFISWLSEVAVDKPAAPPKTGNSGEAERRSPRLNSLPEDAKQTPVVEPVEALQIELPAQPGQEIPPGGPQGKAGKIGRLGDERRGATAPSHTGATEPVPGVEPSELSELYEPSPIGPMNEPQRPGESMAIELRFYREAREVFMNGGDNARALALWDRYLAEFPSGTFGPEARFSRAVCLLRLGQKSQAKMELEAFANGSGYRKREAEELLSALNGNSGVAPVP